MTLTYKPFKKEGLTNPIDVGIDHENLDFPAARLIEEQRAHAFTYGDSLETAERQGL
jgi:hypothetical protein